MEKRFKKHATASGLAWRGGPDVNSETNLGAPSSVFEGGAF